MEAKTRSKKSLETFAKAVADCVKLRENGDEESEEVEELLSRCYNCLSAEEKEAVIKRVNEIVGDDSILNEEETVHKNRLFYLRTFFLAFILIFGFIFFFFLILNSV